MSYSLRIILQLDISWVIYWKWSGSDGLWKQLWCYPGTSINWLRKPTEHLPVLGLRCCAAAFAVVTGRGAVSMGNWFSTFQPKVSVSKRNTWTFFLPHFESRNVVKQRPSDVQSFSEWQRPQITCQDKRNICHIWSHLLSNTMWKGKKLNPYPTAFPYGNGMVLHFYQQQESSTTKTVHKVINKGLKTYV